MNKVNCLTALLLLGHIALVLSTEINVANFIPTVAVDSHSDDAAVGVDIPAVMNLDTNRRPDNSFVDLSVLGGLVTVLTNRTKQPSGQESGPVTVSVFGIPVYVGQHSGVQRPPKPAKVVPTETPTPSPSATEEASSKSASVRSSRREAESTAATGEKKNETADVVRRLMRIVKQQSQVIRELRAEKAAKNNPKVDSLGDK